MGNRTILINTQPGHNKYYIVEPSVKGEYIVKYAALGREPTRVIYSETKKPKLILIANKIAKGYKPLNQSIEIGDIVTVHFTRGPKECLVVDNFIRGASSLKVVTNDLTDEIVEYSAVTMVRKVNEGDNCLYRVTLPGLMKYRDKFMKEFGYLD